MICNLCKTNHPGWDMAACRKARLTQPVNTSVNTPKIVNTDRHKPGYMADYMRKRRASDKV